MASSDYDNVHVVPVGVSSIEHRGDVDLHSELLGMYPVISSPMKGVSGPKLVIGMGKNNCLGILHRFDTLENRKKMIDEVSKTDVVYGVAIGFNNFDVELSIANYAVKHGAKLLCVDVSNGYIPQHREVGSILRDMFPDTLLMSGNVVTVEGANYLQESHFDLARIGIGSGSHCQTRAVTGIGRNQLAALRECSFSDIYLVSDGGIDEPGKAVKSFAAGGDFAMLGGVLAKSLEAENDGILYGMASLRNHLENGKEIKSIEGFETTINNDEKKPLKDILDQFLWGIRSAATYLNCRSYTEIARNSQLKPVNEVFSAW